jgi:hypothetical protein
MKNPTNQTAEVLYEILNNESVSRKDILISTGVLNPTARIADLRIRYGIDITCESVKTRNKFSRQVTFGMWSIRGQENIEKARAVYNQINTN